MDLKDLNPSDELLADFHALDAALEADASGDKTRALVGYLKQAEVRSQEMVLRTEDFAEKRMARLLQEGFASATRIVRAAWGDAHGVELAA